MVLDDVLVSGIGLLFSGAVELVDDHKWVHLGGIILLLLLEFALNDLGDH